MGEHDSGLAQGGSERSSPHVLDHEQQQRVTDVELFGQFADFGLGHPELSDIECGLGSEDRSDSRAVFPAEYGTAPRPTSAPAAVA